MSNGIFTSAYIRLYGITDVLAPSVCYTVRIILNKMARNIER